MNESMADQRDAGGDGQGGAARGTPLGDAHAEACVAALSRHFLALGPDEIDDAVRDQLAFAAELAGADATRLVVADPSSGELLGAYDWLDECAPQHLVEADKSLVRHFVWSSTRLMRGEITQARNADALPPEAQPEREDLLQRGIKSMLLIPVRSGDSVIGGQLFETFRAERVWTEREITRLRMVGEIFASSIKRKRTELALRGSEARFRAFAENAMELVAEFDAEGRYCYASPSYRELLGHDPAQLIGRGGNLLVHPDDRERSSRGFAAALKNPGGARSLHRLKHQDGSWLWFENTGRAYLGADGTQRFVSIGRDVTENREGVEALERQLAIEKQIAELSRRFLTLDADALDGAVRDAVEDAAQIAGADRAYLLCFFGGSRGRRLRYYEWCREGVPSYRGESRPWLEARLQAGEILHCGSVDELPPEAHVERASLERRGVQSVLAIPFRVSGRLSVIGFESFRAPRRWSQHEVALLRLIGEILASAIARRRTDEVLRESEAKLSQARKLEAVGRLAGGIAHDFNNLLTVILGFSRPLLRELAEADPVREDVSEINEAAERAAALTRQLLTFSRRQNVEDAAVDLNATLAGLSPMLGRMLGEDIEIVLELGPAVGPVKGDPHQFEQLVMNLAANARDAMPEGGQLLISTADRTLSKAEARDLGLARAGSVVLLRVSDNGVGIDAETRAQIFDPFFTTKDPGEGTGLGLAIVYSVVEQAGGAIEVHSLPGKGTSFEIVLPGASDAASARTRAPDAPVEGGTETVLLVEDEAAVRRLTRGILRSAGYQVLEASNGVEALELAAAHPGPIHALLSDVVMPRMGGYELAQRLAETRPELRTLFVSGYPGDSLPPSPPGAQLVLIAKPFREEELLEQLRAVLS